MVIADYDVTVVKSIVVAPGRKLQEVASIVRVYYAKSRRGALAAARVYGRPISARKLT